MEKPETSEKFTVEDIHKIREYNYERRKAMSLEDRLKDIKESANECEKDIDEHRRKSVAI